MSAFNVGDKVRVTDKDHQHAGKSGKVEAVKDGGKVTVNLEEKAHAGAEPVPKHVLDVDEGQIAHR
jgi:hypothetical protein